MPSDQNTKYTVTVQLELTRKTGEFKSPEKMADWIAACLNCNTNHVEASVKVLLVDQPANGGVSEKTP